MTEQQKKKTTFKIEDPPEQPSDDKDPSSRCVVIGGGFAGAKIATYFDSIFDVTLIDEKNFLEASQTELLPVLCKPWNDQTSPLMARSLQFLHRYYLKNADIVLGTACHVSQKFVTLADGRKQPYDVLVLATGEQRPYPFSTQQRTISGRISELRAFNKFLEKDCKKIAIIGGGPMGVALASCLVENQPEKEVVLFHRQNELTPGLPRHVRSHALRSLTSAHNNGLTATIAEEGKEGKRRVEEIQQQQKGGGGICPSLQLRLNSTVVDVRAENVYAAPAPDFVLDNEERRIGAGLTDPPPNTHQILSGGNNSDNYQQHDANNNSTGSSWWRRLLRLGPSTTEEEAKNKNRDIVNYLTTFAEQLEDRKDLILSHDPKIIRKAAASIPHTLPTATKFTVITEECWKSDEMFSNNGRETPSSSSSLTATATSLLYGVASYIPPLFWLLPSEQLSHSPKPLVVGTGKKNLLLLSESDAHRKAQNDRSILHRVYFNTAVPSSSSYHADTFIPKFRKDRDEILGMNGTMAEIDESSSGEGGGGGNVIRKEFKDFDYVFNLTGGIPRPIITPDPNSPLLKQIPAFIANPDFTNGTNPNILDEHVITSNASLFSFRHIAGLANDVAASLVKRIQQDSSEKALYSPYAGAFESAVGFAGGGLGGDNKKSKDSGTIGGGGKDDDDEGSCRQVGKYRASSLMQLYRQPNIFAIGSCNALPWVNSVASADIQTKHLFKNMNKIISSPIESPRLWVGSLDGINPQRMRTPRITLPLGRGHFPEAPSGIIKMDEGPPPISTTTPNIGVDSSNKKKTTPTTTTTTNEVIVGNNGTSVYANIGQTRYSNGIGSSDIAGAVVGAKAVEEHNSSYSSYYSEFIKPIFFKKTNRALTRATVNNWLDSDITDVTDFTFV